VALPEAIQLEIVAPDRLVFSGEVQEVTIPGAEGYLGILPGHAPLLSELKTGIISYPEGEDRARFFCSSGFAEVLPDRVIVLAEEVEAPEEIDGTQARADREQAEQVLRSRDPGTDYGAALILLEQASARLQLVD
jgi:F-type H+-transporting ATPase subunit epsilon